MPYILVRPHRDFSSTKRQEELSEALDYDIANDEEDEELKEEYRVEAAAEANRG